jgi:hypothetical protein
MRDNKSHEYMRSSWYSYQWFIDESRAAWRAYVQRISESEEKRVLECTHVFRNADTNPDWSIGRMQMMLDSYTDREMRGGLAGYDLIGRHLGAELQHSG